MWKAIWQRGIPSRPTKKKKTKKNEKSILDRHSPIEICRRCGRDCCSFFFFFFFRYKFFFGGKNKKKKDNIITLNRPDSCGPVRIIGGLVFRSTRKIKRLSPTHHPPPTTHHPPPPTLGKRKRSKILVKILRVQLAPRDCHRAHPRPTFFICFFFGRYRFEYLVLCARHFDRVSGTLPCFICFILRFDRAIFADLALMNEDHIWNDLYRNELSFFPISSDGNEDLTFCQVYISVLLDFHWIFANVSCLFLNFLWIQWLPRTFTLWNIISVLMKFHYQISWILSRLNQVLLTMTVSFLKMEPNFSYRSIFEWILTGISWHLWRR